MRVPSRAAWAVASTALAIGAGVVTNMAATGLTWPILMSLTVLGLLWASVEAIRLGPARPEAGGADAAEPVRAASTAPPWGCLPPRVRGRDALVDELTGLAARPDGRVHVLCGLGGVGKTTVAVKVGERVTDSGAPVWWINAGDRASLGASLTNLLAELGATPCEYDQVNDGNRNLTDMLWRHLEARSGWLLVIDNADDPQLLAAPNGRPEDGNGIARGSSHGLVLVTSRVRAQEVWGARAACHEIDTLPPRVGAKVLRDLAGPAAGSLDEGARLAKRLGGLPLALRAAALYLKSDIAKVDGATTYGVYHQELELLFPATLARKDAPDKPRETIAATWELSLNALDSQGLSHARMLMRLLGGFEAAPIPTRLLDPGIIARRLLRVHGTGRPRWLPCRLTRWLVRRLAQGPARGPALPDRRRYDEAVHRHTIDGLCRMALLQVRVQARGHGQPTSYTAHPLIFEVNRMYVDGDPALRRRVAVTVAELIASAVSPRDPEDMSDSRWLVTLTPHVARALDLAELVTLPRRTRVRLVNAAVDVARAVYIMGDYHGSYGLAGRTHLYASTRLGATHPATLAARHRVAGALIALGRHTEAETELRLLLPLRARVLGKDHPDVLRTRHNLAYALDSAGRHREAIEEYWSVLERRRQLLGTEHRSTLRTGVRLAHALAGGGRHGEARELFSALLDPCLRVLGEDHPETLDVRQGLAQALSRQGRYEQAESEYREIVGVRTRILGPDHPQTVETRRLHAQALMGMGHREDAAAELHRVLDTSVRLLGTDHPESVMARDLVAKLDGRTVC